MGLKEWNEAVEAVQVKRDRAWAAARLGSDLYQYDWAFVIAPDGSTFYAAHEGEMVPDDITKALGTEAWQPLVERGRLAVTNGEPGAVHAFIRLAGNMLGIAAVAAIVPEESWSGERPGGAPYALVVVRRLNGEWLGELALALGLSDLSFSPATDDPATGLVLKGPDGSPAGSVSWMARRPGTEYLIALAPWLGVRGHHTICSKSHANGPFHMPVAFHHDFERGL